MCLNIVAVPVTTVEVPQAPLIAKKTITAYKWLLKHGGTTLRSPHRSHLWTIGVTELASLNRVGDAVHQGLHAYRLLKHAVSYLGYSERTVGTVVVVVKVTIPKGAEYYLGDQDIVSNRMKIVKILTTAEKKVIRAKENARKK